MKTLLLITIFTLFSTSAFSAKITIACGAVGAEYEICKKHAEEWAKKTGNKVSIFQTPNSTSDRLALFQQFFSAKSDKIDVVQIDVIWPGLLGKHFIDLKKKIKASKLKDHFKPIVDNNTGPGGELLAIPFFTDAGLLYYRKDLLKKYKKSVPKTWEELKQTALDILAKEKNPKLVGFVWQGRAYEGLTCNALEWIDSYGGGTIIDGKSGEITINNEKAIKALEMAASWIGTISPKGVLNYDEEAARGVFQSGNAIFMRNWPYAWALGNNSKSPIKGKIGVAALPKGGSSGKHTGTLGGWNLAVSKYSNSPKESISLALYMTSKKIQLQRAIEGAYNPTIVPLYKNRKLLKANPFFGKLFDTFKNAVARPSKFTGRSYNKISTYFWNAVHSVLTNSSSPKKALKRLEKKLKRIKRRGWK